MSTCYPIDSERRRARRRGVRHLSGWPQPAHEVAAAAGDGSAWPVAGAGASRREPRPRSSSRTSTRSCSRTGPHVITWAHAVGDELEGQADHVDRAPRRAVRGDATRRIRRSPRVNNCTTSRRSCDAPTAGRCTSPPTRTRSAQRALGGLPRRTAPMRSPHPSQARASPYARISLTPPKYGRSTSGISTLPSSRW